MRSVLKMYNDRLPRKMMLGELLDGKRSVGGRLTQWNRTVLQDMTDFEWISGKLPTGAGVSETAATKMYKEYRYGRWKEIIAHDTPERGNGCLRKSTFTSWTTRASNERDKEY
jgi:hypothetical protein